jgi:L-ascorbate metabolism protein UlaG (beta-lactamase superfamily)
VAKIPAGSLAASDRRALAFAYSFRGIAVTPTIATVLLALTLALYPGEARLPPAADGISITLIANEGVLLSGAGTGGTRQVLIDGLFEPYGGYAMPPQSTSAALRQARPPFTGVDLVLVTHHHGDHFHPRPVAGHLAANRRAVLVASRQVVDSLRSHAAPELFRSSRIVARTQPPGSRRRMLVNDVPVDLIGLPHGGRRHRHVEHLAFVVELGGRRVLHLGDAELTEETLAPFGLDTMRIDVALIPYWAVTDGDTRRVIERWIRPGRMAAFHIADGDTAGVRRDLAESAPRAHLFTRRLETITW